MCQKAEVHKHAYSHETSIKSETIFASQEQRANALPVRKGSLKVSKLVLYFCTTIFLYVVSAAQNIFLLVTTLLLALR